MSRVIGVPADVDDPGVRESLEAMELTLPGVHRVNVREVLKGGDVVLDLNTTVTLPRELIERLARMSRERTGDTR